MSGNSSGVAGNELRKRVAARMGGTGPTPPDTGDDDLPLNDADKNWIKDAIKGQLNVYFASGEGNPTSGRIVQASTTALKNTNIPAAVWNTLMPTHSVIKDGKETAKADEKAKDTVAGMATGVTRIQLD